MHPVTPWVHDNNAQNVGFTAAVNRGLHAAYDGGYDYALVLNQDCYLRPDAVGGLVGLMEREPRCGIAGVKQLHSLDEDVIIHGGCLAAFPAGRHLGGRRSAGDHAVSRPMPWVNGAAMFARMAAVREFGTLDPNMRLVGSDSDWCYTARARGWDVWYCAAAEAVHEQGVTGRNSAPVELQQVMAADMAFWRDKWVGTILYHKLSRQFPM